jgi:hypothetical protein
VTPRQLRHELGQQRRDVGAALAQLGTFTVMPWIR